MKLLRAAVENFGSYRNLELDFENQGLSLIYGKTGSGKSTIPDIACWALYGVTARGGSVDDIKSWTADGEPTKVTIEVETLNGSISVVRIRSTAKQNDLYWVEIDNPSVFIRGKDLQDTQKKLTLRLGLDSDSFASSSSFHEFSPTGNFFISKAKDRRSIFEGICNLELPARIAEAASIHRKSAKVEVTDKQQQISRSQGKFEQLEANYASSQKNIENWEENRNKNLARLEILNASFTEQMQQKAAVVQKVINISNKKIQDSLSRYGTEEEIKAHIELASASKCGECGGPAGGQEHGLLTSILWSLVQERKDLARNKKDLETLETAENPHGYAITQLKGTQNPFHPVLSKAEDELEAYSDEYEELERELVALKHKEACLDQLYDLSSILRGELLRRTVSQIEQETNRYLETYFDAEIKVEFAIDSTKDDLQVIIKKSGYDSNYIQLSKGQRSLLRLCFSVAVMAQSSNKSGIHQDCLFFDEFTDGLDEYMKEKVFGLLSELETRHGSIFVIDHTISFQNLFSKRLHVTLQGDESHVESEN